MLAAFTLFVAGTGVGHAAKPNIVVILTDDQGWGDLSLNGNTNLATPNIDSLARDGASFENFYVSPVCSPTRAEFLTGRYHPRGNVYSTSAGGERLNLDETTIGDVFKTEGYATGAFGKWHNGTQYPYHPNGRGFDEFYGFCSGHWGNYFSPVLEHNGRLVQGEGFITDDLTDQALRFIEKNKNDPFFCYIPYNTPHSPMQVPDKFWKKFENADLKLRHRDPEKEDLQHTRAALAMMENIDWNVGRLLAKLDELDLTRETIVVFFSDNGPNGWRWNGDMKGRKGSTDEGGVRSPLILRWPGKIRSGKKIPQIAAAIDLLPTLAHLAWFKPKIRKPLDGVSLATLLITGDPHWPDRNIVSHWNDRVSVRNQRYRLDDQGQLFDMITDHGQRTNLSQTMPGLASAMSLSAQAWRNNVLQNYGKESDARPFIVGHPKLQHIQLPARDAQGSGNLRRSNRYPNSSFFTDWISTDDQITWDITVPQTGEFDVEVYYTCAAKDLGSTIELSFNGTSLVSQVREAHDPPLIGAENDRVPRMESYDKYFQALPLGRIKLKKGAGQLTLRALDIPGAQVMDFRLLMLTRTH